MNYINHTCCIGQYVCGYVHWPWSQADLGWDPALLLTISVVLGKSFKHSYLQYISWDNKETYFRGLLGRLNEMMSVEPLVYSLTWSKC